MLRTTLIVTVLAMAGCATTSTSKAPNTAANTVKPPCVSATRLPQPNCGPGTSYSQQDLNSTGQQDNNLGTSLRMLDPAIR
jgi:hypothetical protein